MGKEKVRVHGSEGAYVGGEWVGMEGIPEQFSKSCDASQHNFQEKPPKEEYDIAIIGAGCIGTFLARELSKTTASVILLDGADDVTQGATKGNSGIVHAGYDDKPGSVRSKFCWKGNQMFPDLDKQLHFGYEKCGSLVIARTPEDRVVLETLLQKGHTNGVQNLRIVEKEELHAMEPTLSDECYAALHSPDAGNLIPYEYAIACAENAVDNGVELRLRSVVTNIKKEGETFTITTKRWSPPKNQDKINGGRAGEPSSSSSSSSSSSPSSSSSVSSSSKIGLVGFGAAFVSLMGVSAQMYMNSNETGALLCIPALLSIFFTGFIYNQAKSLPPPPSPSTSPSPPPPSSPHPLPFSSNKGEVRFTSSPGTTFGGASKDEVIKAKYVVNCAGCHADEIAKMVGDSSFQILPRSGDYILLHKKENSKAKHILFPTPHPVKGKGVLVQRTLWGNLILGPTARDWFKKDPKSGEYVPNEEGGMPNEEIVKKIVGSCQGLVPSIDPAQVIHTFSGVRAKSSRGDWIIEPCKTMDNFFHCAGIDSPGLAGSPAIALHMVELLQQAGAPVNEKNPRFNGYRAPIIIPKQGYKGLKMGPVGKHTDPNSNVICKCEKVLEREVIEACHRSIPIDSTQAIRKRTRAGMGHCQGDPDNYGCEARVAAIIAREKKLPLEEVGRRPWPASSILPHRWMNENDVKSFLAV